MLTNTATNRCTVIVPCYFSEYRQLQSYQIAERPASADWQNVPPARGHRPFAAESYS
jgi:hypothetical protein